MNFLKNLIADGTGAPSSMRIAFLLIISAVLAVWVTLCIRSGSFIPLPNSILTLLGVAMAGKVGQSLTEAIPTKDAPSTPPQP